MPHAIMSISSCICLDRRPYWFDMPEVIEDIWTEVTKMSDAMNKTAASLTVSSADNIKAQKYTGVRLVRKTTYRKAKEIHTLTRSFTFLTHTHTHAHTPSPTVSSADNIKAQKYTGVRLVNTPTHSHTYSLTLSLSHTHTRARTHTQSHCQFSR